MKLRSKKQTAPSATNVRNNTSRREQIQNPQNQSAQNDNQQVQQGVPAPQNQTNQEQTRVDKAESLIRELFENIDSRASYSRAIDAFIKRNDVYSKFKPTRKRFRRRKTIVHGPFNTYQIDLSDYRSLRHSNKNYGWILFVIDAFSRYGYVLPLKHKTALETREVFEKWLLSLNPLPKFVYSDEGKEFTNSEMKDLFKTRGIQHFILRGAHKAAIVERFQRTIKTKLEMYFYKHKTKNWLSVIDKIVDNYNHRYHRSIKLSPAEVTYENFETVYKTLYPENNVKRLCRLGVGDIVRVAIKKKEFSKGYHQTFSDDLYQIVKAVDFHGVCVYTVQNTTTGEKQKKYYYELSLVIRNDNSST